MNAKLSPDGGAVGKSEVTERSPLLKMTSGLFVTRAESRFSSHALVVVQFELKVELLAGVILNEAVFQAE